MSEAARFTRPAQADLREAVAWIARENPAAADALRLAALEAARLIGRHPHAGQARPELAPDIFRFFVLRGFPYVLVYEPAQRRILRMLHGARDLPEILSG